MLLLLFPPSLLPRLPLLEDEDDRGRKLTRRRGTFDGSVRLVLLLRRQRRRRTVGESEAKRRGQLGGCEREGRRERRGERRTNGDGDDLGGDREELAVWRTLKDLRVRRRNSRFQKDRSEDIRFREGA